MPKCVGILTAGGDSPGLNAAIRAVGKTLSRQGYQLIGFRDGFEGIAFDRTIRLDDSTFSGILTVGGTVLRTSRNKPHKMPVGKDVIDMTGAIVENYNKNQLECLICIGGGGTHKSALRLKKKGLNIITLPKTIDNDLAMTDATIGFDTATGIATQAIDSLHSTASSHNRIIVVQIMGNRAGWLTLASGIAGGADVILIPEIPYSLEKVSEAIKLRSRQGKLFSIVPVAEGAYPVEAAPLFESANKKKQAAKSKKALAEAKDELFALERQYTDNAIGLAKKLENITGIEARVTILGYLQRGGKPSSFDRILATQLGSACANAIINGEYGIMISAKSNNMVHVPLEKVAGKRKTVPLDHPWIKSARKIGVSFGD